MSGDFRASQVSLDGPTSAASPQAPTTGAERAAPPVPQEAPRKRPWRKRIPFSIRLPLLLFVMALIIEYLVVPKFILASRSAATLERLNPFWLSAGVLLEVGALISYSMLTRVLLPANSPPLFTLVRIDFAGLAIAHVVPGGTAGSATLGYRLLTSMGVSGEDAGFAMATQGMGSAVVLNVLMFIALVVSIPLAGVHPFYVLAALIGVFVLVGLAALVFLLTRGEESAVRFVRALGRRTPRVTPDQLERVVRHIGSALRELARDRDRLWRAVGWAAVNWLLDAASLWCFVAALGTIINPVYLFVAYGVGNVLAAIPVTPAGLGLVEASVPAILTGFGAPARVAALAVLGWRFINFWAPIPLGAAAYVSLRVGRGADLAARREALRGMAAEASNRTEDFGLEEESAPAQE